MLPLVRNLHEKQWVKGNVDIEVNLVWGLDIWARLHWRYPGTRANHQIQWRDVTYSMPKETSSKLEIHPCSYGASCAIFVEWVEYTKALYLLCREYWMIGLYPRMTLLCCMDFYMKSDGESPNESYPDRARCFEKQNWQETCIQTQAELGRWKIFARNQAQEHGSKTTRKG
jgi:hypothetical protein